MVRPEGKVSVNDRLDFAVESALVIEKIRVATWPGATVAGSNFLVSCGVDKYRALTTPAFTEPDIVTTFEESVDGAPASVVVPLPPVVTVAVFTLKALESSWQNLIPETGPRLVPCTPIRLLKKTDIYTGA